MARVKDQLGDTPFADHLTENHRDYARLVAGKWAHIAEELNVNPLLQEAIDDIADLVTTIERLTEEK